MEDKLKKYREKRDFERTKEPTGGKKKRGGKPIFVIQKHDARNLHYDFRLEIDGVLKSWVIPKGPSTDPRVKRLAMPTEDHPLDYADFEGIIPEGEYGGGTVLVWDRGQYRNRRAEKEGDRKSMEQSFREGKIEIYLEGKKLKGGYALIRTGKGKNERWLFIKMRDEEADARRNPVSTESQSVLTGRTLEDIKEEGGSEGSGLNI
jgi:DNA ligase D-like protein (predicted 3'-phosphoesterase)